MQVLMPDDTRIDRRKALKTGILRLALMAAVADCSAEGKRRADELRQQLNKRDK